jgi:hypothetical protein
MECADYAYNYGKRLANSRSRLWGFRGGGAKGKSYSRGSENLRKDHSSSINTGTIVSCCFAFKVKELVPEPYCWLSMTLWEGHYVLMDPDDNVFDMKKFERCVKNKLRN